MRYSGETDWFEIWRNDIKAIIETMISNIQSDLKAGYSPEGNTIKKALDELNEYRTRYEEDLIKIRGKTIEDANHWCYVELIRKGAIE